MNFELSDDQRLVRETARTFADEVVAPLAKDNARNAFFDTELVRRIAGQGYLGAIVPREYGGAGLDHLTYGLIWRRSGARTRPCAPTPPRARVLCGRYRPGGLQAHRDPREDGTARVGHRADRP